MGPAHLLIVMAGALLAACSSFSCDHARSADIPKADGEGAYELLVRQVEFGPRIPGTDAHRETRDWLAARLRDHTSHVAVQAFTDVFDGKETEMYNIVASFYPEKTGRVMLCAHWDTRPRADRDPAPSNRTKPVPGANDGASGVAVLLDVARALQHEEPPVGVDIVLFDGEDGGDYGDSESWLLGSRHFARVMPASFAPRYAILLDMIGDRDLELTPDSASRNAAPALWGRVQTVCGTLGIPVSPREIHILDDHIPLIERGIPAVDLIDFDYPWWHTVEDTPDKCSPQSLRLMGDLVLTLVYGE